ncbi:FAD-dependent oxidoreductase (plasmid) [Coraliomargarita sp. W4R53]
MRVGIIGAGAAGLTTAWLLDPEHEVFLFEKDDRLGGHAHTVEIEAHGQRVAVDAGFQFFAASDTYATFNRLLDALGVTRETYPATLTVYRDDAQHPVAMPPVRHHLPVWQSFTPRALSHMIRFRVLIGRLPAFLAQHDMTITIDEYLEQQRLPKKFVDEFLYPMLLAFWCVELAEFRTFAAYNVLYYLGANVPKGLNPPHQSEIVGGLKTYVDALASMLSHTSIHLNSSVQKIARESGEYVIQDAAGARYSVDHVIFATNAHQAARIMADVPQLDPLRDQLERFEYFDTTIAIHGDERLMPRNRAAWSVVNVRWNSRHSSLSIWNPARGLPVFKSWVTFEGQLPEPLYALATYSHGKITVDYFDAQRELRALQGLGGVWIAGLYAADADSHESAVRSAVAVVQQLAPHTARLVDLAG